VFQQLRITLRDALQCVDRRIGEIIELSSFPRFV
jgi:hypothetical protein